MMTFNDKGFGLFLIILAVVIGVIGWGVIEGVLWLLSFVSISFGR